MKTSLLGLLCAVLALLIGVAPFSMAQGYEDSVLRIAGASSIEELSESEAERFENLRMHPLPLNTASRSALRSSGLFTPFQIASLLDYRLRSGDILSFSELALLDGFSREQADALRPFVSLASRVAAGASSSRHPFNGSLLLRDVVKADEGALKPSNSFAAKMKACSEGLFELNAAWRGSLNGSLVYYGRRHLGKLVVGDFNMRFGQGLAVWNGFSLSGFSSSSAFCRRASGISPTCSWTPADKGIAADFDFGPVSISAAAGKSLPPVANLTLLRSRATFSATCQMLPTGGVVASQDALFSLGNLHPFYEVAWDSGSKSAAALAGAQWEWAYRQRLSLLVRCYPPSFKAPLSAPPGAGGKGGERGVAIGLQRNGLDLTLDAAVFPSKNIQRFKAVANLPLQLSSSVKLLLRAQEQYRPQEEYSHKACLRSDLVLSSGAWQYTARLQWQYCCRNAFLGYLEAGRKDEGFQLWGRAELFSASSWDDRIYVYERDAPGNFTLRAFYGRGAAFSLYTGWKTKRHRLYLRLSDVSYSSDKPDRVEAHLQYGFYLR